MAAFQQSFPFTKAASLLGVTKTVKVKRSHRIGENICKLYLIKDLYPEYVDKALKNGQDLGREDTQMVNKKVRRCSIIKDMRYHLTPIRVAVIKAVTSTDGQ